MQDEDPNSDPELKIDNADKPDNDVRDLSINRRLNPDNNSAKMALKTIKIIIQSYYQVINHN